MIALLRSRKPFSMEKYSCESCEDIFHSRSYSRMSQSKLIKYKLVYNYSIESHKSSIHSFLLHYTVMIFFVIFLCTYIGVLEFLFTQRTNFLTFHVLQTGVFWRIIYVKPFKSMTSSSCYKTSIGTDLNNFIKFLMIPKKYLLHKINQPNVGYEIYLSR